MSNVWRPRYRIRELASGLRWMRPPPAQAVRTALWILAVVILVSILYATAHRVTLKPADPLSPYLWTATLASAMTAVLGALAAFEIGQPGHSRWWPLLPMPALALWFAATGFGCIGTLFAPNSWGVVAPEAMECLLFILGTAVPLSVGLLTLIRWAEPRHPTLVGAIGGLAVAATAVSLLTLVHPHNSALLDILAHGAGVAVVVVANVALAGRWTRNRMATL